MNQRVPVRHYVHPGVHIKVARCDLCGLRSVTWRKPDTDDRARYCVACISKRIRARQPTLAEATAPQEEVA